MTSVAPDVGPTASAGSSAGHDEPRRGHRSAPQFRSPLSLLVLANAVSLSGNVIMTVAIPWLVLTTTGSAALAATAVFAGVVGAAVGGLAAGRVVDAIGAVRTSSAADLLSGIAVVPLPILLTLDVLEIWHVVVLALVGTLADSAGSTARQSLVPAAADTGGYARERANALFTSAEHVGYLLGAPVAGLLIAAFGVGGALWVTVASFGLAALLVGWCVRLPAAGVTHATDVGRIGLRETVAFIWKDPALRALVLFPTAAVLMVGPLAPIVLPVLARETFGDPVMLGVMVASYGAGGLVGAAGYGLFGSRVRRRRLYVGVFVVLPSTFAGIALTSSLPVILAMLLTLGAAAGALVPLQATIRQERAPARLLPRVVGLSTASIPVAAPIGVLGTGFLIDGLGLHHTLVLITTGAALLGAVVLCSRGTRAFDAGPARPPSKVGVSTGSTTEVAGSTTEVAGSTTEVAGSTTEVAGSTTELALGANSGRRSSTTNVPCRHRLPSPYVSEMRTFKSLLVLASATAAVAAVLVAPSHAAVPADCAPDAWEPDGDWGFSASIAAPVTVGDTVTRAICQAPNPFPRTSAGQDFDFFRFTAAGGKAYTGEITAAGSALGLGVQGGLQIGGLYRVNADGSGTSINGVTMANSFERFTTDVLPAGEYGFLTYTPDNQVYPNFLLDIKTISGEAGAYTVKVSESAVAAPTVASVTLRSTSVKYGSTVQGTITMSGPAPEGGMFLFSDSSSRLTANPSSPYLPAGARTVGFTVTTTSQRPSRDTKVTISYNTTTGTPKSVVLTVRR